MKNENGQYQWEDLLEHDLAQASPKEVLDIIKTIAGWLVGYCIQCGEYNNIYGGNRGCKCNYKGSWND